MSLPWLIRSAGWFSGSPAGRPVDRAAELSGGERLRGFPVQFGKARQQPRLGLPEAMQAEGTQASGSPWIAEIGVDPGLHAILPSAPARASLGAAESRRPSAYAPGGEA